MAIETITYDDMTQFSSQNIVIYGIDESAASLFHFLKDKLPTVIVDFFLAYRLPDFWKPCFLNIPVVSLEDARSRNLLEGSTIVIASKNPLGLLNSLIDDEPKDVFVCSRALHGIFHEDFKYAFQCKATKESIPFMLQRDTPKFPCIITNAYGGGPSAENIFELADYEAQEYTTWRVPAPGCPYPLSKFSVDVPTHALPMRMSHVSYLLWQRGIHVAQLSPSKRFMVGARYNYFFLDILDLESDTYTRWHDLPASEGDWLYVATGDFDGDKDQYLFVRWPFRDAVAGMQDGSNRVHCQVGRLDLVTKTAEILHEFDFQDRIHQCTISGDGRYMVFAPMRVLRPEGDPKKLKEEDIMRNLQQTVVLDSMATLDLQTGKVWYTQIPYPIPAHFELDPYDPHLFYVSTHSLMPFADGVLCFQPGTLHKLRILNDLSVIEGTFTYPGFIRTTCHCVYAYQGRVYMAATNQNKLEIIDAESMTSWHRFKIADDPFYDTADFSDPDFLKKPFKLPGTPAWCSSICSSADGSKLILRLADRMAIFDMATKSIVGSVQHRSSQGPSTHSRYWMQNAPYDLIREKYGI